MTGATIGPHWNSTERRTGFFLYIVPTVGLAGSARRLYRRIRQAIEADAVLYDLVTVGLGPIWDDSLEQEDAVTAALIARATSQGHLFAPQAVFSCLVVGPQESQVEGAIRTLETKPLSRALRVVFSGHVLAVERRRDLHPSDEDPDDQNSSGIATAVVAAVAFAEKTILAYERDPYLASDEYEFLTVYQGFTGTSPAPTKPDRTAQPDGRLALGPAPRDRRPASDREHQRQGLVGPVGPRDRRDPTDRDAATDPSALSGRRPWDGPAGPDRIVASDRPAFPGDDAAPSVWRGNGPVDRSGLSRPPSTATSERYEPIPTAPPTLWQRAKGRFGVAEPELTEDIAMDLMAGAPDAVGLVYLVFVPDDKPQRRAVHNRRSEVAAQLDAALGDVGLDPGTSRELALSVDVLCGVDPLVRFVTLRPAGLLQPKDIPRVPVELFDIYETTGALLREHRRIVRSIQMRRVDVLNTHVIFLATTGPLANLESLARFAELLTCARITWLHFGPAAEMISDAFELHTGYQAVLLQDQPDIVNLVMHYSEDLYQVALPDEE